MNKIVVISDKATNGDVIKFLFPDILIKTEEYDVTKIAIGNLPLWHLSTSWWNEPYKLDELKENK